MIFLNSGGARVVFRDGERVYKYPYSPSGVDENKTEAARYLEALDHRLAECRLRSDGVVDMEYLEDRAFEYSCWESGVQCDIYDLPDRRVQPKEIVCSLHCEGCAHNCVSDYSVYAEFPKLIDPESRVQCGEDVQGRLKIYDYGYDGAEESGERTPFQFYPECAELFEQWIADGNKPEDFSGWADSHPDQLPKRGTQKDYRFANKRTRELVCSGEIHWDKEGA